MEEKKLITAGAYSSSLEEATKKYEKHAKRKKTQRNVILISVIAASALSVILGIGMKGSALEREYQSYRMSLDRTMLNSTLLEYRDTWTLFEKNSLGNEMIQSQMGGYFYDDGRVSIYPDPESGCTIIEVDGTASTLSGSLAADLNVFGDKVYFRDTGSMELMVYSIPDQRTTKADIDRVGRFVVCDGMIVFKDLSTGILKLYQEGDEPAQLSESKIVSFAVVGNEILYLAEDHFLHSLDIRRGDDVVIGENINSFLFDSDLWLQNNMDVYTRSLTDETLSIFQIGMECRRLLGKTDAYLLFEGPNAICVYDPISQQLQELSPDLIFVGASGDGRLLVYQLNSGMYKVISLE